jgi:hypothetical protein
MRRLQLVSVLLLCSLCVFACDGVREPVTPPDAVVSPEPLPEVTPAPRATHAVEGPGPSTYYIELHRTGEATCMWRMLAANGTVLLVSDADTSPENAHAVAVKLAIDLAKGGATVSVTSVEGDTKRILPLDPREDWIVPK